MVKTIWMILHPFIQYFSVKGDFGILNQKKVNISEIQHPVAQKLDVVCVV